MTEKAAPWPRTVDGVEVFRSETTPVWFVASRTQEGVWWRQTWGHDGAHDPFGISCTCPFGRAQESAWQRDRPCWHVRQVLLAEAADGLAPRPSPQPTGDRLKAFFE